MRLILLLPLIVIVHISNAQKADPNQSWSAGLTTNIAMPGSAYIALQPCAELQFQNRFSVVLGYSFKFIDVDRSEKSVTNEKYERVLLEGRYRLAKKLDKAAFYTSIQLTQSKRKFSKQDGSFLYEYDDDSTTFFTRADVKSPVTTASLQLGLNSRGKKKFFIDVFAGMGIRFTNTRFYNIEGKSRALIFQRKHFDWDSGLEVAKFVPYFHLTGGIRFFYRIK